MAGPLGATGAPCDAEKGWRGVSWPKSFHSELEQITKCTHCTTLRRISESAHYTRRRSKQSGETPALFALGELLQFAVSLLAADQLILSVRQGKGAVSHNACADKPRQ